MCVVCECICVVCLLCVLRVVCACAPCAVFDVCGGRTDLDCVEPVLQAGVSVVVCRVCVCVRVCAVCCDSLGGRSQAGTGWSLCSRGECMLWCVSCVCVCTVRCVCVCCVMRVVGPVEPCSRQESWGCRRGATGSQGRPSAGAEWEPGHVDP